jgi:hypothetical protein
VAPRRELPAGLSDRKVQVLGLEYHLLANEDG